MANSITAYTLTNGARNLIVRYVVRADGSGNYTLHELFNFNDYLGEDSPAPGTFAIDRITWSAGAGTAFELWFGSDSNNDKLFFASSNDFSGDEQFPGGLNSFLADENGQILITTSGFDADGDTITVTLHVRKKVKNPGS